MEGEGNKRENEINRGIEKLRDRKREREEKKGKYTWIEMGE